MPLIAQRHGRPDAVQNYMRGLAPPEVVLDLKTSHQKVHFRTSDLKKLKRSTVVVTDPKTNKTKTYEGVDLEDLLSTVSHHPEPQTLEVSFGFFHKKTIHDSDLHARSDRLVADTVDGKRLSGDMPFCFVAEDRQGNALLIRKLVAIRISEQ
jgi:hypothetical protein